MAMTEGARMAVEDTMHHPSYPLDGRSSGTQQDQYWVSNREHREASAADGA